MAIVILTLVKVGLTITLRLSSSTSVILSSKISNDIECHANYDVARIYISDIY